MAEQVFTAGQVLTAAQQTTLQTNIGLCYITSGSLATGTTNLVGVFSSTYNNYRITLDTLNASANSTYYFRMLSGSSADGTAQYYHGYTGIDSAGNSTNISGQTATIGHLGYSATDVGVLGSLVFDIFKPFIAQATFLTCQASIYSSRFGVRNGGAQHNVATSYDGIQLATYGGGNMTGTYTVYGYRKA
jgi:hypothetical protein